MKKIKLSMKSSGKLGSYQLLLVLILLIFLVLVELFPDSCFLTPDIPQCFESMKVTKFNAFISLFYIQDQ